MGKLYSRLEFLQSFVVSSHLLVHTTADEVPWIEAGIQIDGHQRLFQRSIELAPEVKGQSCRRTDGHGKRIKLQSSFCLAQSLHMPPQSRKLHGIPLASQ